MVLVGATASKLTGLFEKQGCHEGNKHRSSQKVKGVAEGEDKCLLLHDVTDGDHGAMGSFRTIGDAMTDKILCQRFDPGAGRLFEQGNRRHKDVGMILLTPGAEA